MAGKPITNKAGWLTSRKPVSSPGHMAYWFGWFSFYPHTAIYGVAE
jgi:hypothetical protein